MDNTNNDEVMLASTAEAPAMTTQTDTAPKAFVPVPGVNYWPPTEDYKAMLEGLSTKSARIRRMSADGYSRTQIAKHLDLIYQHVRNVLMQPAKRPAAVSRSTAEIPSTPVAIMKPTAQVEPAVVQSLDADEAITEAA